MLVNFCFLVRVDNAFVFHKGLIKLMVNVFEPVKVYHEIINL